MFKAKSWRAFTLIELMIVIAIIAILAAVLVPSFMMARALGQLTSCKSNLKSIGTALEMYSTDFEGRYPTDSSALTPNYLKTIPTCPSVGTVTYNITMASNPDLYTVVCAGSNHVGADITAADYPQFTSVQGLIERP